MVEGGSVDIRRQKKNTKAKEKAEEEERLTRSETKSR